MKVCGITAEYNPFHNGHRYQIEKTKEKTGADVILAVMSGNFVQRGEPAVIDKWERAKAAVLNGVDVVIELPNIYALQAASRFAHGSVTLLKAAQVDCISFGSECGNLENLQEIAEAPINPDHLREYMAEGLSYPKAYSLLTSSMAPNDILAVSYLKEMQNTKIEPVLIQRTSGYLDDTLDDNCSALAIRKAMKDHKDISQATPMHEALTENTPVTMDLYYPYLRTLLLTSDRNHLQKMFLVNEGIETHLRSHAKEESTWEGFLSACTSSRYTESRIRRTCIHIMTQTSREEAEQLKNPEVLRVLAFNETGRAWLHEAKKREIRIASRYAEIPKPFRSQEYRSTLLYTSVMEEERRREILQKEIEGARYIR